MDNLTTSIAAALLTPADPVLPGWIEAMPGKSARQMMDELAAGIARIEARRAAETARRAPERRRALESARRALAGLQQDDGLAVAASAAWLWADPHPVRVW